MEIHLLIYVSNLKQAISVRCSNLKHVAFVIERWHKGKFQSETGYIVRMVRKGSAGIVDGVNPPY